MQKVDTAELRRLHEAAREGDWKYTVSRHGRHQISNGYSPVCMIWHDSLHPAKNTADFIAAAHNALPALLDELEAAREEVLEESNRWVDIIRGIDPEALCDFHDEHGSQDYLKAWLDARDRRQKLIGAAEELRKWTNGSRNREIKHYDTYYRGVHDEMAAWLRELNERAAELEAAAREGEETK